MASERDDEWLFRTIGPVRDYIRLYHLKYNSEALALARRHIGEGTYSRLRAMLDYRIRGIRFRPAPTGERVALAFSGGVDSTASLKVLRWAGFEVVPITAMLPQFDEGTLARIRKEKAVEIEVEGYEEAMRRLLENKAPVCGRCHAMAMKAVEDEAKAEGLEILVTGDTLSFGLLSIYRRNDLTVLNLPAFLALSKRELINLSGERYRPVFGCSLLWEAFRRAPGIKKFSIERVLREVRAGVLTPDIATALIEDILSR